MRDARKGPREEECNHMDTCTSGTGHCMLCHPPATLESLCLADAPPRWQPFRFARRRRPKPFRREISAHPTTGSGFRQPSASTGCMTLRVSPFCVAPRATISPAMRYHTAHMPNHAVAARRLSGAKANSGKRNPEGAVLAGQGPPEWSPGAGRRAGGTGHGWPGSGSLVC